MKPSDYRKDIPGKPYKATPRKKAASEREEIERSCNEFCTRIGLRDLTSKPPLVKEEFDPRSFMKRLVAQSVKSTKERKAPWE